MSSDQDYLILLDYLHGELPPADVKKLMRRLKDDQKLQRDLQILAQEESSISDWAKAQAILNSNARSSSRKGNEPKEPSKQPKPPVRQQDATAPDSNTETISGGTLQFPQVGGFTLPIPKTMFCLGAIVAGLMLILICILLPWGSGQSYVATITREESVQWKGERPNARVKLGQVLSIAKGRTELQFASGPRLVLEGPCEVSIDSSQGVFLHRGILSAEAESRQNFYVDTPLARLADRGTRFAAAVTGEQSTEVRVFAGVVEAISNSNSPILAITEGGSAVARQSGDIQPAEPLILDHSLDEALKEKTVEASADQFICGGEQSNRPQSQTQTLLLKRDVWKRLGVCRKAYIRFDLSKEKIEFDRPARFSFQHAVGIESHSFRGRLGVYALKTSGNSLANWQESTLTWENAPANKTDSADSLSRAAELIDSIDISAGSDGDPPGTSYTVEISNLKPYLQADGTFTVIITVVKQPDFDPNLHIASREHETFAGPMLTFQVDR